MNALQEAAKVFDDVRDSEHHALSTVALARAAGQSRAEVAGLYRRGRFLSGNGRFVEALGDFERALALVDSTGLGEYRARLHFEIGAAHEASGSRGAARRAYERSYDEIGPEPDTRERARLQTLSAEGMNRTASNWIGGLLLVALILIATLSYGLFRQRRQLRRLRSQPAAPPEAAPPASDAFTRCYRRAYEALTEPEKSASIIDDPVMSAYLKERGRQAKGRTLRCDGVSCTGARWQRRRQHRRWLCPYPWLS